MSPEQSTVEVSRWAREAEQAVAAKMSRCQMGEAFLEDPPISVMRFVISEARRLVVLALFVSIVGIWLAVLN